MVDYICGQVWWWLVKNCDLYRRKNLNINIEGRLWRHAVTSSVTSSTLKFLFCGLISDGLSISSVKMNLSNIFQNLKYGRHFEVRANFQTSNCTGCWVLQDRPYHCLYFELLFDGVAQISIELWQLINDLFFTSWPSYLTYILVQRTCRNHGLVLACDSHTKVICILGAQHESCECPQRHGIQCWYWWEGC